MKKFFKKEVTTNLGIFLIFCTAVLVSFLSIPLDESAYEESRTIGVSEIDISRQGVHENASPDESCRLSEDGLEREVLVSWFDKIDWKAPAGKTWIKNSEIDTLFPDIYPKIEVNCRGLTQRGLSPFRLKAYKEGVWLQEGAVCLSLARFCGIPKPQ